MFVCLFFVFACVWFLSLFSPFLFGGGGINVIALKSGQLEKSLLGNFFRRALKWTEANASVNGNLGSYGNNLSAVQG